jgi:cellulase/cellobiase CelA1
MDINHYWRTVRRTEESLPAGDKVIYLVSIENAASGTIGGVVTMAAREYAARWIAGGTHKPAEADDIERYEADLRSRTAAITKAEIEKKQTIRLENVIPDDQLQRAVANALAEHARPKQFNQKETK